MKRTKNRGFTLIELVVVMVIIGILSVISVPMYRNYVERAMGSEGKAMIGGIAKAEKVYYAEFGRFLEVARTNKDSIIDVDARTNTYYPEYTVVTGGAGQTFFITAHGNAEAPWDVTYDSDPDNNNVTDTAPLVSP